MMNLLRIIPCLLVAFCCMTACQKDDVGKKMIFSLEQDSVSFGAGTAEKTVPVIATANWQCAVNPTDTSWCYAEARTTGLYIKVKVNKQASARETIITLVSETQELSVYVRQLEKGGDAIFADAIYSSLRSGVTQAQINTIKDDLLRAIAQELYDNTYPSFFRIQSYEPYPEIQTTTASLKTSGYNPFENPTGIYFEAESEVVIFVEDTQEKVIPKITLRIHDFNTPNTDDDHLLYPGMNKVKVQKKGLGYIQYYTDKYQSVPNVKIHITGGKINGYFHKQKHQKSEWLGLLNGAVYDFFDVIGDRINLTYTTDDLKSYCNDGMLLISRYDEMVDIEHDLMGLTKHNRRPKNKMFARTVASGLFADGIGAGFAKDCMWELADPEKMIKGGCWAIAHELGHVNQIRPGLKWVSTTEVTNNIYSLCARYRFTPDNMDLECGRVNDGDEYQVVGGRFNSYFNYGIVKGEQWLCQRGHDKMTGYENGGDHFVKLCPLWQLMLYYRIAGGTSWQKPDWYGDVAEIVRNTDESRMSNGELQLNFMRNTADVVKEDLSDFFVKAGMLKPIDKDMDDYVRAQLTITQAQCDELIGYMSKYPKPTSPVIYYLTANSLEAYQKQLSVEGSYGEGVVDMRYERCFISHSIWKNVVVFETYSGDSLTKVAMVGTRQWIDGERGSTFVRYPTGSTRIEAVAWDGKRTLVYGSR